MAAIEWFFIWFYDGLNFLASFRFYSLNCFMVTRKKNRNFQLNIILNGAVFAINAHSFDKFSIAFETLMIFYRK